MTTKTKMKIQISAALLLALAWVAMPAYATGNNNNQPRQEQDQHQGQAQGQEQGQHQGQTANGTGGEATAGATATNEGIEFDASDNSTSNVENNSSNVVLVPNNNTEKCLRVWGIAWGKDGQSGALGVPWRSKKCDYEQAADDAFAAGERELGWFWKCENPNLYKTFKSKQESKESAKTDCYNRMVGSVTQMQTINTLREQLTTVSELREIDNNSYKERMELQRQLCEESNNRVHEACQAK